MKRITNPSASLGVSDSTRSNVGSGVALLTHRGTAAATLADVLCRPRRSVCVNDRGYVVGQDHHRSKLSDADCDLIRDLRAEGVTARSLAEKFECSTATVYSIGQGRRRGQMTTGQKRLVREVGT